VQRYPDPGGKWPATKASVGWLRGHIGCLHNFMRALHEGRQPEPGLEAGAQVQRVVAAAKESEREGSFVRVDEVD
jgi:predicted dehydrogenase